MGKEKIKKRYYSFWPLSFSWGAFIDIFRRSSGFTLVELLTVIGVIGILLVAAILILDPVTQAQKANDAKRKSDLSQIQKALETYHQDNNRYPLSSPDYKIINLSGNAVNWGEISTPQNQAFGPYIIKLPKDPVSGRSYVYFANSTGQIYYLYASLERNNDKQLCNSGNPCASLSSVNPVIPDDACGSTCNYGVSSSNTNP